MKKSPLILLIIGTNIILMVIHIHKHSKIIALSFLQQKNEDIKQKLIQQKNELEQRLYLLQDKTVIKNYALHELKMEPIKLSHVQNIIDQS